MSLTTCIKKAGKALDPEDRAAIVAAAGEYRRGGMKGDAAAKKAVQDRIAEVQAMLREAEARMAGPMAAPVASEATAPATHTDPGEPAEVATPAVVAEAIKTAADNRGRKPSEMRAELLAMIDAKMGDAKGADDMDVRMYAATEPGTKMTAAQAAEYKRLSGLARQKYMERLADEMAAQHSRAAQNIGYVTFKVPGDGTFRVLNTKSKLEDFRKRVAASPRFKAPASMPKPEGSAGGERGYGGAAGAITGMIDEGDPQAAVDYAAARGLDIADVLKGDKVRLGKIAGLEPTGEAVGEFEPEVAEAAPAPSPAPAAQPAVTRSKPVSTIDFSKPIVGPSGARLLSYTWQWKPMEFVDARGEERVKRISDWDASEASGDTGRDVVHQFVVDDNGTEKTVSAESALKLLGFAAGSDGRADFNTLSSAAKTLARLRMQEAELQQAKAQFDRDNAEVQALPLPAMPTERDDKGWFNLGDASVRQIEPGPMNDERRRALIGAWRDNRLAERGWRGGTMVGESMQQRLGEVADRIKRQQAKVDKLVADAPAAQPVAELPAQAPAEPIAWHTPLPEQGEPATDQDRTYPSNPKSEIDARKIVGRLAREAMNAITRVQMTNITVSGMQLYPWVLPAQGNRYGVVRLLPEDQVPGGAWQRVGTEPIAVGGPRDRAENQIIARLGSAPILATGKAAQSAAPEAAQSAAAAAAPSLSTFKGPATAQRAIDAFNADDAPLALAVMEKLPLAELKEVGAAIGFRPQINENAKSYRARVAEVADRLTKTAREQSARERALFDKLMDRAMEYDRAADHAERARANGQAEDSEAFITWYRPMGAAFNGESQEMRIPEKLKRLARDVRNLRSDPDYDKVAAMVRDKRPRVFEAADAIGPSLRERAEGMMARAAKPDEVQNFGEALPPARRAMAAKLDESLSDADIANRPLSEIWPLAENEAIEDTFAAAVAHAARAEVPAKPRVAYKLKQWVQKVKTVRELAGQIVSGRATKEQMAGMIVGPRATMPTLRDWWSKVTLLEQVPRDQWKRIGEVEERPDAAVFLDGKPVPRPMVRVRIDEKSHWIEGGGTVADALPKVRELLSGAAPEQRMEFAIYERRSSGTIFVAKKGDPEKRSLMEFATVEEARAAVNEYDGLAAAWEAVKARDNITERDLRSAENRPRTGKDHRGGKDVTVEQFQETFGFRGGEFGKWVQQGKGDKERQALLNQSYDALMDLADIIGVPPRAMSLNGTLGLALGSRGSGWASAHFEPSNLVINLTKTRGAGTLAHEWFHALDNYFSRMRRGGAEAAFTGNQTKYRDENYITHRPESLLIRKDRARGFAPLTQGQLEARRERLKAGTRTGWPPADAYDADKWERDPSTPEGVRPEVEQRFAALVQALKDSPMAKRAALLDKSGGYWTRTLELAARSFENYVIAKMHEQGYHNDFLVNVKKPDEVAKSDARYPYLLAGEVKPIADAFDALFSEVKTRDSGDGNVAMFSRTQGAAGNTTPDTSPGAIASVTALNDALVEYGLGAKWANAYEAVTLPDALSGIRKAFQAAFGRDVRAVAPTAASFNIFNGIYIPSQPRTVYVNTAANVGFVQIAGHELWHDIRRARPELIEWYRSVAQPYYKNFPEYQAKLNALLQPGEKPYSADKALEELEADFLGDSLADPEFLQALADASPSKFRALLMAVRMWLQKVVSKLKGMGSSEYVTDVKALQGYLRDVMVAFADGKDIGQVQGAPMFQRVWHGTPHRGIEKFSTEFIGTGEGAQAYGWGIYLASRRDVAEYYRKSVSDSRGSRLAIAGNVPASPDEGLSNDEAVATKDLAELFVPNAKVVQTFGSLNVVGQGRVLGMVRRLIQNREVLDAVVGLVPVDVVNMLGRGQLAADGLLNNPAVLVDLLPANANDLVSSDVQAMNVLAPLVAVTAAKVHTGASRFGVTRAAVERAAASAASEDQSSLQELYRKIPQPSEFVKGQLYEVDIPEDSEMLLWDKPLSEQSEKVRKQLDDAADGLYWDAVAKWSGLSRAQLDALPAKDRDAAMDKFESVAASSSRSAGTPEYPPQTRNGMTGEDYYRALATYFRDQATASETLLSAGIKGIKYLDGTSRGAGEGTFNYVIFSGDDVEIQRAMFSRAEGFETKVGPVAAPTRAQIKAAREAFERIARNGITSRDDLQALTRVPGFGQWAQTAIAGNVDASGKLRKDIDEAFPGKNWKGPILKQNGIVSVSSEWVASRAQGTDLDRLTEIASRHGVPVVIRGAMDMDTAARLYPRLRELGFENYGGVQDLGGYVTGELAAHRSIVLIRPAGDITRTTPMFSRAADQTNTKAFRDWFGDSKVVDADGKPLVVYHGTGNDFSTFMPSDGGEYGAGIYVTPDAKGASDYARYRGRTAPNVMPVYVSIKNPAGPAEAANIGSWRGEEAIRPELIRRGYDGIIDKFSGQIVAFRPEQIKSATGNRGTFDPADPDIRFSRAAATGMAQQRPALTAQDLVKTSGGVFDFNKLGETKQDRIRSVIDKSRPFWLGALTRDQIADIYGKEIPQIKEYDTLTRAMENQRSSMAQQADDLYQEWSQLPTEVNDRLARIMLDATVNQVHPDREAPPPNATDEQRQAHARVRTAYKLMPKEGQAMYAKVRDAHAATLAELRKALEGRINRAMANGQEKAAMLADIRKRFDQYMTNGPYFPLTRFGDFLVVANREDGERVVASYESAGEQQAAARALQADGFTVKLKTAKTYNRSQDGAAGKFIGEVLATIEKTDMVEATINGSRTDLKNQLLDDINQLFIRALPDMSYRKHFAHRKNTPGFSADVMRGFASSAFHSASHIARLNHSDRMTFELEQAFKVIEQAPEGDFNQASQVLNEMAARHEAMLNPQAHPLSTMATQVGFTMYLGLSPAAGLINMLQVPMVALPYIGARHGFRKATAAMSKAYTDIMAAKANRKSGFNAAQSPKLTPEERQAISTLQDEGVIDLTQAHDLAAATERDIGNQARSRTSFAIARAMRIVGWTFHVPEVMNRQVTALMAYRLEMEKDGATVEQAMDAAREAIKRTQFDYSSSNRARYMQGNIARVVTQFKQFSQNMTYFLGRAAYQALKDEDPEVRRIARRQILSTFAVTGAMAGSMGLPGIGFFGGMLGMLAGAMDDEDEPWDWKAEYRNLLADTFGKEVGEVLAKGVPRALMPAWDISGRVGLSDLWWRGSDREGQNPRESFASDMANILGPTAGTVLGWYVAADHMQRGNYAKATEAIVPKFIRDPIKAAREATEGVTSYTGEPLMETTAAEELGRLLGFAPARVSEMYEGRNAVINAKTAIEQKRQALLSQIVKARLDGDAEAVAELRSEIAGFNERNPEFRITNMTITKSLMNRRRNRANTEDGIMLPDSKDALRERGRFAAVE